MSDHQPRRMSKLPLVIGIVVVAFAVVATISGVIVRNFYTENKGAAPAPAETVAP